MTHWNFMATVLRTAEELSSKFWRVTISTVDTADTLQQIFKASTPEKEFDFLCHLLNSHLIVPLPPKSKEHRHRTVATDLAQPPEHSEVVVRDSHVILIVLRFLPCKRSVSFVLSRTLPTGHAHPVDETTRAFQYSPW